MELVKINAVLFHTSHELDDRNPQLKVNKHVIYLFAIAPWQLRNSGLMPCDCRILRASVLLLFIILLLPLRWVEKQRQRKEIKEWWQSLTHFPL